MTGPEVAVVGQAWLTTEPDGRTDAELLEPVIAAAMAASGLTRDDVDVVCSASSEFLNGVVGSMMGAFDVLPCWPPRVHTHHEGDGAFAFHEAWLRLLAGDGEAALVCAYGRPLAADGRRVLSLQLDPYTITPLGPDATVLAALQARALLDAGRITEAGLAATTAARRGLSVDEVLAQPHLAPPLRAADCSDVRCGAAAVVLATGRLAARASAPPAWIAGIEQRIETSAFGARDLTTSASTRAAAERLGLRGAEVGVVEIHAPYSHQEAVILDALDLTPGAAVNPSGGALVADPLMVTGLIRVAEAARAVTGGHHRAVGHASNGPCLQHNLVCDLRRDLRRFSDQAIGATR